MHDLYSLESKAPSQWNWLHEIACGDLYVAYKKCSSHLYWNARWDKQEYKDFARDHRVNYDRRMNVEGMRQTVFWEVDRNTEILDDLKEKVKKYCRLADTVSDPFVVIFTLQGGNIKLRAERLLHEVIAPTKRGRQFLATPHQAVLDNPLGKVLVSYLNPSACLSLTDLS